MSKGTNKTNPIVSTRQIIHTRLYDDANLETRYEILNKLGEGSFGTVFRVRNKETDLFYAMKTIAKKPGNKSKASSLDNEVKLLTEVNHPNLIQLHEVLESSQNLYLIVDLCEGGELGAHVKKMAPLPEETVKQIISKLVSALYYLHKMDIVHRDLKLENILLKNTPNSKTDDFDIRVTDFGLSSKKSITNTDSLFNDYCGTPLYMAPEILENKNYSALCDVWALGIIMYYLICGRHPYVANDERRLLELIRSQKLRFDSDKFKNLSPEGLDFLQGMLVYDTVHRRTMGELTVHPWLTGRCDKGPAKDIITMMREFQEENERRRITAENNSTSISNDDENPIDSQISTNQLSEPSTPNNQRKSLNSDKKLNLDKNKTYSKTNKIQLDSLKTPKRPNNPSNESELTDSTSPSVPSSSILLSRFRSTHVQFSRSHSQVDLLTSSSKVSQQRTTSPSTPTTPLNNQNRSNQNKTPPSSSTAALFMINKHQSKNSSSSSLPTISNHHHANKLTLNDKQYSNHT